ncbi:hypothetical protein FRC04_012246 [Tulasnella sp. 424]|nr:hypothetical protein FRC04_012246 [Tulasnella sp. 424]KAG8973731.1 hypothetical protein FRC05_008319 [Tulasnella sp. 425]
MSRRSTNSTTKTTTTQPTILATSQTSRFHTDTLTTLSTEIDLKQVNISVGQNDLLVDVDLRLKSGVHYALVGRNGEGKSTLLKALADKIIPGIAENLRVLLIDQVTENQTQILHGEDMQPVELTVTQTVVRSNRHRERLLRDRSILLKALETPWQNGQNAVAVATATIQLARSKDKLDLANKTALKRSGARGIQARKDLKQAEKEHQDSLAVLQGASDEPEKPETLEKANNLLMEVQDALEAMDAEATEARARSILRGLGFSEEQLDAKFSTLSGGWRSRCALASGLLQKPNLAILWLQNYIANLSESTVVVISHDRDFLDAITEELIVLRNKTLTYFDGNPSQHARFTLNQRKWLSRMKESQDKKKEAMEKTIADAVKLGKKTGDEGKLRMAKSRQKKLDERWGMEVSAKGTRFKLNRDLTGYHDTARASIEVEELDKPIKLHFPDPEPLRFPGALISVTGLRYRYSPQSPYIIENVDITIHPGSRIAFVGRNGQGKSTLVKLLVGMIPSAKVERHPRLKIGYYDQHSVEELSRDDARDKSVVAYFMEAAKEKYQMAPDEGTARAVLGTFGLAHCALNSVHSLSGGQKVRLALSLIAYWAPNLLVLDEVSTHLDLDSIQALVRALRVYSGAILLVSHDRYLVRCLVEGAPLVPRDDAGEEEEEEESGDDGEGKVGSVYIVSKRFRVLEGGMDEYVRIVEKKFKGKGILR